MFRRRRKLDDFSAEIQAHLKLEAERLQEQGLSYEEARAAAHRAFGNVTKAQERFYESGRWLWWDHSWLDLRFALRMFRKSPGFTTIAVLTLALGIGANTAIFSIIDAVLLRPLPYEDSSRLVMIWQSDAAHRQTGAWFDTYSEFEEWAQHSASFEKMAAFTWVDVRFVVYLRGMPERIVGIPVTADFFSTLGVNAAQGRTFAPQDAREPCAVVLSNGFWRGQLGAESIVGRTLNVNHRPCAVAGIMPKDFTFYPKQTQIWVVIPSDDARAKDPWNWQVGVLGRLKPGVTRAGAQAELATLQKQIINQAPTDLTALKSEPDVLQLQSEFIWLTGRNLRESLWLLFAAVGFVLVIACVNVATLFLGRMVNRRREFGVRATLGSTRSRTIRQLLTESLLLSLSGALLAVFVASTAIRCLNATDWVQLPPGNPVRLSPQVLAFSAVVAILSAIFFGIAPAWKASRYDINALLKNDSRSSNPAARIFVVAEVALSLMLLAGAGLMVQSLLRFTSTPLGFQPPHLFICNIDLPTRTYRTPEQRMQYYDRLKSGVLSIPGVQGFAIGPLPAPGGNPLSVEGRQSPAFGGAVSNDVADATVNPSYFRVLGIPLLRGRAFDANDRKGSSPVAIVNEALAERYLQGDPIGQQIKVGNPESKSPWLMVVGLVGDVKRFTVFNEMAYVTDPCVYQPLAQSDAAGLPIFVRSALPTSVVAPAVRKEFSKLNGDLPQPELKTMHDWLSQFFAQPRFRAVLLSLFAVLALVLCSIGILGVVSHSVVQRTHELGVRMALGANSKDVLRMVIGEGALLAGIGIACGIGGALVLTRFLRSLLFEIRPTDPLTFAGVALALLLIALFACYIPARRATRVDPMIALRYE
jgi:predicted permease